MIKGSERDFLFLEHLKNGLYSVSEEGVITKSTGKIISTLDKDLVSIGKDRVYFSITRTRAIWLAFNGPLPSEDYVISLKKGCILHLDNLELITRKDLNARLGKAAVLKLNPASNAKFSDEEVVELRKEFRSNPATFFLRRKAREWNVSHVALRSALIGKTYKRVPNPIDPSLIRKRGNCRPSVWNRKNCPSYKKETSKPLERLKIEKPKIEPKEKIKPVKDTNVVQMPRKPRKLVVKMTEEQKLERLEMMKQIGKRLSKLKEF